MLVIEDELLLTALLRALCTVKFDCSPECDTVREVAGSPLVAEVANRAYDALIETCRRQYRAGEVHRLEQRRPAEGHPGAVSCARARIRSVKTTWPLWSREQKEDFVRILLSPYTAGPELVASVVAEADANADGDAGGQGVPER